MPLIQFSSTASECHVSFHLCHFQNIASQNDASSSDKTESNEESNTDMEMENAPHTTFSLKVTAETQKDDDRLEGDSDEIPSENVASTTEANESHIVVTEVYELYENGDNAELKEVEVVRTKTPPLAVKEMKPENLQQTKVKVTPKVIRTCNRFSSDQGFQEGDQDGSCDSSESNTNLNSTFTKDKESKIRPALEVKGPSTRTRTRKVHSSAGDAEPGTSNLSTAVGPLISGTVAQSILAPKVLTPENCEKSTRTRMRAIKAAEQQVEKEASTTEVLVLQRTTRTRQRKVEEQAKAAAESIVR